MPQKKRNPFTKIGGGTKLWVTGLYKNFAACDTVSKLSLLVWGLGNAARGQIIKGLLLLSAEISYIIFMANFGLYYIKMLPSLGVATQYRVFDEAQEIYIYIKGDNSLLILLFGVVSVMLSLMALCFAYKSMQIAYKAQSLKAMGKKLPTFTDDFKNLFDKNLHFSLLTLPALGVFAFTIMPLVFMILMAFTNFDRYHQPPGNLFTWVGLENFKNLFWKNSIQSATFFSILSWTLIWAVLATFTNYILGMILALMINKKGIRLKKMWRTIFISTIAVPQFVSLLLMSRILHDLGPLNILIKMIAERFGFSVQTINFLTNGNIARVVIVIVNMWVGIPYTMLATTGILMNIPEELYESARIDGANPFQEFRKITLPYMMFVMTPQLITTFVANINNFNVIYLLAGGGPLSLSYFHGGKTDLLVTWLYRLTVNEQNYSVASTVGILVFSLSAGVSLIFYNRSGSMKREEEFS